jgi:hypothetical protein
MDDDDFVLYGQESTFAREKTEPLDVSILRHSIAAAVSPVSVAELSSDSEVVRFSGEKTEEEETRPVGTRSKTQQLDKTELKDRSLRVSEITSSTPDRSTLFRSQMTSTGYFRDTEHTRALRASEKAKRILESPYLTKKRDILSDGGSGFSTPRKSPSVGRVDISQIHGVTEHIERIRKSPAKPEPQPEEFIILPNPPDLTPSFRKVSTILVTEMDEIIQSAQDDTPL